MFLSGTLDQPDKYSELKSFYLAMNNARIHTHKKLAISLLVETTNAYISLTRPAE
jgi:hypothetical protein